MDILQQAVIVAICAAVLVGSICRLDMMRAHRHRGGWIAYYTLGAVYAFGTFLDLAHGRMPEWHLVAGVLALLLQLVNTRTLWRDGPPAATRKEIRPCN
jgi:hypothetical protein